MAGRQSFVARNSVTLKLVIIGILSLLLLIPAQMVNGLISERQARQQEAINEVSSKWGNEQTITGPVLSVPYSWYNSSAKQSETGYVHFLPEQLTISGEMSPQKRSRGIYDIVVYSSRLHVSGKFTPVDLAQSNVRPESMNMSAASVDVGISDLRGIKDTLDIKWNGETRQFNPGLPSEDIAESGVSAPVNVTRTGQYEFSFDLDINGSQHLYFTPSGKITTVSMKSTWNHPSFDGAFLPDSHSVTGKNGFSANWKVLHLNRNFPQVWAGSKYSMAESAFGVNLIVPVDSYLKTSRSIKYAILCIVLTFLVFFFIELLNKRPVHPFQYLLIGLALCIFYSLLLSISEHLLYDLAYLISGVLTIGLVTLYARGIFGAAKPAWLVCGTMFILYGFIFTIVQLEDYALLMGSIGLFITLATVMYYSRKIDWFQAEAPEEEVAEA